MKPVPPAILTAAFFSLTFATAFADPPASNTAAVPTLHSETRVVEIDVVAADSNGKPVGDLTKSDFTVTDAGKTRTIDIFTVDRGSDDAGVTQPAQPQSQPPNIFTNRNARRRDSAKHSTVIILDQGAAIPSGERTPFMNAAYASQQAIGLMGKVPPDEQIALYVIARKDGLIVLQDYTTDRQLLVSRLKTYIPRAMSTPADTHPDKPTTGPGPKRRDPNAVPKNETAFLQDEVARGDRLSLQALAEHLALVPGRKSIFWVSEGFPPRLMHGMGQPAWDKTIAALNEANVAVNVVNSAGMGGGYGGTLAEVAQRTGGQAWLRRNDLDAAMAEGIAAARTVYTLAFYLADDERDSQFHELKVQTSRPGLNLYYRQGYYAGSDEMPASSHENLKKAELESSLINRIDSADVGITARIETDPDHPRDKIGIRLNLDPETLSLKDRGEGWTGKVEELLVEQNESGDTLAKVSEVREFQVPRTSRNVYDTKGITLPVSMQLRPGATRITIVVRDTGTGHVGSLTIPLN